MPSTHYKQWEIKDRSKKSDGALEFMRFSDFTALSHRFAGRMQPSGRMCSRVHDLQSVAYLPFSLKISPEMYSAKGASWELRDRLNVSDVTRRLMMWRHIAGHRIVMAVGVIRESGRTQPRPAFCFVPLVPACQGCAWALARWKLRSTKFDHHALPRWALALTQKANQPLRRRSSTIHLLSETRLLRNRTQRSTTPCVVRVQSCTFSPTS